MNITKCILKLHPAAQFLCWENDYDRIEWQPANAFPLPTLEELNAAWPSVQADDDAEIASAAQAKQDRAEAALTDIAAEIAAAQDAVDKWATLTNAQKDALQKQTVQGMIVLYKLARYTLRQP